MKSGDKVLVTKPNNLEEFPTWNEADMDRFDGQIVTLKQFHQGGPCERNTDCWAIQEDEDFVFSPNWLTIFGA